MASQSNASLRRWVNVLTATPRSAASRVHDVPPDSTSAWSSRLFRWASSSPSRRGGAVPQAARVRARFTPQSRRRHAAADLHRPAVAESARPRGRPRRARLGLLAPGRRGLAELGEHPAAEDHQEPGPLPLAHSSGPRKRRGGQQEQDLRPSRTGERCRRCSGRRPRQPVHLPSRDINRDAKLRQPGGHEVARGVRGQTPDAWRGLLCRGRRHS